MSDEAGGKPRSLAPLWAMVAVFAAPVIAAWFFYLNPEYLPAGRTNKGELIEPVVALPADLALSTQDGTDFSRDLLAGKWTLVYLAGGACDDACRNQLIAMRQIRLALGESQRSVERLLVLTDATATDLAQELGAEFAGMRVALGGGRLPELLLLGEDTAALDRIYILDPRGNLMMRYAADAPARDTLEDMERLLKASKNWIKGAQYGHK
ncbi:SCO family protein [Candidatus Thiosymbion oneisti]|uniref:SCO family protein n=1 Tax=Candidatus Thiosymbion oneisti TaxID=589554 RepID=UPI00105E1EA4|nr:SCO family protein [Candidatus Thiosymbion oneisti]